jgi:hypothetical protein
VVGTIKIIWRQIEQRVLRSRKLDPVAARRTHQQSRSVPSLASAAATVCHCIFEGAASAPRYVVADVCGICLELRFRVAADEVWLALLGTATSQPSADHICAYAM